MALVRKLDCMAKTSRLLSEKRDFGERRRAAWTKTADRQAWDRQPDVQESLAFRSLRRKVDITHSAQ